MEVEVGNSLVQLAKEEGGSRHVLEQGREVVGVVCSCEQILLAGVVVAGHQKVAWLKEVSPAGGNSYLGIDLVDPVVEELRRVEETLEVALM